MYVNKDAVLADNCAFAVVHNSAVSFDDVVLDSCGEVHLVASIVVACAVMAVLDFESYVNSVL